jgi:hypothetical protein
MGVADARSARGALKKKPTRRPSQRISVAAELAAMALDKAYATGGQYDLGSPSTRSAM